MRKLKIFVLLAIVFIFLFCRIYNFDEKISFDRDYERDAFAVKQIIVEKKPILLGHQADNEKGFFMAPYFFYLLSPFYFAGHMQPLASMKLFVIFHNLMFLTFAIIILKKILGFWGMEIFLLLVALNPLMIGYQSSPWNPSLIPTSIILFWYLYYLAYKKDSLKLYMLLGLLVGVSASFHFQFIFQAIPMLFLFLRKFKPWQFVKKIVTFGVFFVMTFLPIFIFDLRHDFLNIKLFLNFFNFSVGPKKSILFPFPKYFEAFTNSFFPFLPKSNFFLDLLIFMGILEILYFVQKSKTGFLKLFYRGQILILISTAIIFSFYPGKVSEYYFLFVGMIFFFTITELLSHIHKSLAIGIIAIIFLFNYHALKEKITDTEGLKLKNKDLIVKNIKQLSGDKKVYVAIDTPIGQNYGFYYLIDYYRINTTTSPTAPLFIINNPPRSDEKTFGPYSLHIPANL